MFDSTPLIVPGRQNFGMQGIYRLKVTNIVGREGVELYPTLEIGPTTPRTEAYLAHNAIPVQFTEEDFDQVLSGNFVTKVIYLPDPAFQEMALANVETLVSTRLDPGMDPIKEADRRGAILAVVRLGNKDIELPGSNSGVGWSIPGNDFPDGMAGCPDGDGTGRTGSVRADRSVAQPRRRCDRACLRDADERHTDWFAGSAAHSARRSGGTAAAHDHEPHADAHSGTDSARSGQRAAAARVQLSDAAEPSASDRAVDPTDLALQPTASLPARASPIDA
jgi:hypothetical protein